MPDARLCSGCRKLLPGPAFALNGTVAGWIDNDGRRRRTLCRECDRERQRSRDHGIPTSVPTGPFVEWLQRKLTIYEVDHDRGIRGFAETIDLPDRQLFDYVHGVRTTVHVATVDRVLVCEGSTFLWELYPELYPDLEEAVA